MKKALLAGSFDPPTTGHLNIITRASALCDYIYIGLAINEEKKGCELFSLQERLMMLSRLTSKTPHTELVYIKGQVADFVMEYSIDFLIRGLRKDKDYIYEKKMAQQNKALSKVDTVFLFAEEPYLDVSSSAFRSTSNDSYNFSLIPSSIEEMARTFLTQKKSHLKKT